MKKLLILFLLPLTIHTNETTIAQSISHNLKTTIANLTCFDLVDYEIDPLENPEAFIDCADNGLDKERILREIIDALR